MIHSLGSLILLFVMSTWLFAANEIDILTPEHGVSLHDETVWLVASTTAGQKGMTALVRNKGGEKKIKGNVLEKDRAFAFHVLLSLEDGLNEVTVGGKSVSIFYRPRYRPVDKSTGKEEVFQDYPPYFFHTPKKEATCSRSQCHVMDDIKAQPKPDCSQCHRELTSVEYVHGPLGEGVCFVCHDPDSAPSSYVPKSGGEAELCFSCHEEKGEKQLEKRFFHSPVEKGKCLMCHDPHGSPFQFQLPVEEKRVCYLCHEEKEILAGKIVHEPVLTKGCSVCHEAHSSNYKHHLLDVEKSICSKAECHPQFAEITEDHPIATHPVVGMFGPERRLSCSGCHNPHSSDFSFLLPGEKHSFCSKCHDDMRFLREADTALPW